MNKKFSTLLCGALALFTFSANAQTWMKIQTATGELVKKGDSVVVVAAGAAETKTAASLWSVEVVARETSGNKIYQFTNKATNTTLKLKNNDIFAVGEKNAVNHQLDTLNVTAGAAYKKLFTVEGGFTIVAKANGTITPDTGAYASLTPLEVVLAEPGDMTHWMTVAELNQCASYSVPLFAAMEGVEVADAAYEFVSTAATAASTDYIFNVKSLTSGKYLAVDSANVTKSSTVNLTNQDEVFGFDVKFGGNATKYKNFGIKFNPVNDSIAVAVMDSTLAWDVTNKKIDGNVVSAGQPVAWLGNVQFVNDKAEYITVDDLDAPTNGLPYWSPAPAQIEAGEPLANGLYILQSKKGIWGYEFFTTCSAYGGRENELENELLPENQWMVKGTYADGIYSYKAWNRFYETEAGATELKKVATCDNEYFIFGTDTVTLKAIEANYGYKVFEGEALNASSFTLGLVNKLGANSAYMVMNADSSLNVLATEEPLEFRAKYDRGASFNGKTFATDTVAVYNLYTLNAKGDTLWVGLNNSLNVTNATLSTKKNSTPYGFVFKMINEGEYMMIFADLGGSCSYSQAIRVHENGGTAAYTSVGNNDVSLFTINEKFDDSEYARLEAGHYLIIDNSKGNAESGELDENEVLTKKADKTAKFLSLGDKLGDEAAIEENFSLWIDSAHVCNTPADTLFPTYYILKGATVDADTVRGDFLTAKGKYTATGDSLMTFVTGKAKINDTMAKVKAADNTFLFKVTDVEGQYTIQSAKNRAASLALINGTVVLTESEIALPVVIAKTSVVPTANENIAAAGVTVIAGNGQITIAGAAGKKVVIANILGQTVANTIIA
ncbi:MAG: hypothetical protein IJD84_06890, partial [Parabacteroides sp.]|nr:hypothetical protein [Parabacteroides sp.]